MIPAFGRKDGNECEANVGYRVRSYFKKITNNKIIKPLNKRYEGVGEST